MPEKLIPPDGGWGWMVVLGASLVNLSTRPIEPSFGLLFGKLLDDLSIGTTGAGIIFSAYEAIIYFSGLFVGPLIKTYSYRKVAIFGSLLTGFGLMATFPAYSMAHILCTYSIINGFGIGFSSSATFVALNYYFKRRRGQAVGITMTGTGLGLLLMPQAIRYLTEEYDFTGSILILGAFALNACVGSALLQPIKWHLIKEQEDEESAKNAEDKKGETKLGGGCPQIKIENTIAEYDEEEEDEVPSDPKKSFLSLRSQEGIDEQMPAQSPRRVSEFRPKFCFRLDRKYSLIDRDWKQEGKLGDSPKGGSFQNSLNKSSTEPKFEKFFEEMEQGCRNKVSERGKQPECPNNRQKNISTFSINNRQEFNCRKRKGSTISNLSNLDFTGSCLQLTAIEQEIKNEEMKPVTDKKIISNNNTETTDPKTGQKNIPQTMWKRFSAFMDLDLLKDPIYLNILFGISIFYIGELNFKMVVPFFLADLGHSKSEIAFCLTMMAASDIVARIILPPICDRLKIKRRTMFMIAAFFLALSRSGLAETGEWIQLETILIISGFFRGATLINFMLVISEYCDNKMDKLPAALGIHMVARGIFIVALGPLIGLIRDVSESYPICIHAQSICMALCLIAWSVEYIIVYLRQKQSYKSTQNDS